MIFVLYDIIKEWDGDIITTFCYKECKSIQEAQKYINKLYDFTQNVLSAPYHNQNTRFETYQNIRIIEGTQNIIDHSFKGDLT